MEKGERERDNDYCFENFLCDFGSAKPQQRGASSFNNREVFIVIFIIIFLPLSFPFILSNPGYTQKAKTPPVSQQ